MLVLQVFGLLGILTWILYRLVIRSAYLSPLSKLPAPHWSCHISARWFERKCATTGELKTLHAAHQRCGPIVRLGPNEVSVVSEEGLKKVYTAGLDKSDWYDRTFRVYGVQNLVCTLDHKTHSDVRKTVAGLYTKSYLSHSSELDEQSKRVVLGGLLPSIDRDGKSADGMDVMGLFKCVGVEFIASYVFGTAIGADFLNDRLTGDRSFGEWVHRRKTPGLTEKSVNEDLYMKMCRAAVSSSGGGEASLESQPSVAAKMYRGLSAKAAAWKMTDEEVITRCASEMVDMIIATQETVAVSWTYTCYRLSQRPELQHKLRRELRTLQPIITDCGGNETLPTPASIDNLPLLNAVVTETLRLHAANPARMRRVVPSSGLELHGHSIPPATIVSTNAYCLHRNADVFPEPFAWQPEKWLTGDTTETGGSMEYAGTPAMRKWFWAFGSGTRTCIGQHFALQVIKLVVAAIYTSYTTEVVDDAGIEQSDSYNSAPVSDRLVLRFVPVATTDEGS